jgi:hypothetical protein
MKLKLYQPFMVIIGYTYGVELEPACEKAYKRDSEEGGRKE